MTSRSTPLKSRLDKWLASNKPSAISSDSEDRPGDQLPLSFGQLRLWLLQQMNPNSPFYIYAESYRITGGLQLERFTESFKKVVSRHDILRTTFPAEEGKPWQKIHSQLEPEILVAHLAAEEADTFLSTEAKKPFDLLNGPLVRLVIVQIDKQHYRAAVVMHHIITDKWSMNILREEWVSLYQGNTLPPLDIQYADFAIGQRGRQMEDKYLQFWKEKLAGDLPVMELPGSKPRSGSPSFEGAFSQQEFSSQVSEQISALTNKLQITGFTFFLTVFNILLAKYSGSLDLLVATPVTNRDRTQLEKVIGFFNETIILRSVLAEEMTFGEALNQVKTTVLEAFANKDVPFESLVRSLKPVVRLLFANRLRTPSLVS